MTSVCCVLCGVPISLRPDEAWVKEFRAVYTENDDWNNIRISGVGSYDEIDGIAPIDPMKRYDDLNLESDASIPIGLNLMNFSQIIEPNSNFDDPPFWGFGLHPPCWAILNELFRPSAEQILGLCLSMPFEIDGLLDWGHDYGGAVESRDARGFRYLSTRFYKTPIGSPLRSDPLNIPAVRQLTQLDPVSEEVDNPNETEPTEMRRPFSQAKASKDVPFDRLPPELLQAIILYLPSKDVGSVRVASRIFSSLSLTDTFWASRFDSGFEFHHVFEVRRERPISWKAAYDAVASLMETDSGLINRKRIWRLATQIEDMTSQINGPCHGCPMSCFFERASNEDNRAWLTASRGLKGPKQNFRGGCRALRVRVLEMPPDLENVFISFVQLGCARFVSGFRFRSRYGKEVQIGYSHHSQEQPLPIYPAQGSICGWHLAFHYVGITAVSVLMEDGTLTPWVGHHEGVPKKRLFNGLTHIPIIKAEFDALKMVSLSVPTTNEPLSVRESRLWTPDIPPQHLFFHETVKDSTPNHSYDPLPFSTVIFGGYYGQDLSQLTEVVAWVFDVYSIVGLQFHYTDSAKTRSFGEIGPFPPDKPRTSAQSDDFRVPFSINGPSGERISSLEAQDVRGQIYGIKIQTNWGREVRVPPPEEVDYDFPWTVIQPFDQTIVGFYSVLQQNMKTIGIMSINVA